MSVQNQSLKKNLSQTVYVSTTTTEDGTSWPDPRIVRQAIVRPFPLSADSQPYIFAPPFPPSADFVLPCTVSNSSPGSGCDEGKSASKLIVSSVVS